MVEEAEVFHDEFFQGEELEVGEDLELPCTEGSLSVELAGSNSGERV